MAFAQDKPYTEGTVWTVSMIRVKPGMFEVYMRDVLPLRKKIEDARPLASAASMTATSRFTSPSRRELDAQ